MAYQTALYNNFKLVANIDNRYILAAPTSRWSLLLFINGDEVTY